MTTPWLYTLAVAAGVAVAAGSADAQSEPTAELLSAAFTVATNTFEEGPVAVTAREALAAFVPSVAQRVGARPHARKWDVVTCPSGPRSCEITGAANLIHFIEIQGRDDTYLVYLERAKQAQQGLYGQGLVITVSRVGQRWVATDLRILWES